MLKLHRLELSGFKSFAERTHLEFSGGVTAIVGPNGCGKSNISDAVAWVLGERSAKQLRGETMDDVIFGGTRERKPLGMAEATLTLLTDPDFPGSEDGRLTIGRRVFQSGEGEYYLNGRQVRLKDIRDLLMDTGLGLRAYSVIEQGKIGMILSGKPQERRKLLEEAAGVTRYKERRRIAEVKLEEAHANLLRLNDVVGEVERSLRAVKRQAGAARRYTERRQEAHELERRVLLGRLAASAARLEEIRARVRAAVDREAERSAAVHRLEAELAAARESLDEAGARLSEQHRRQADLAATIEGRQQFLKAARERVEEIGARLAAGDGQAEDRRDGVAALRESLGELDERLAATREEQRAAASEVDLDAGELAAAEQAVEEAARRVEESRSRLMGSLGHLTELRNARQRTQIESARGDLRGQQLADDLEEGAGALEEAEATLQEAEEEVGKARHRQQELEGELQRRIAELESARRRQAELQEARQRLGERAGRIDQRLELLEELTVAHQERRRRLRERLAGVAAGEVDFLGQRVRPRRGWEAALDRYLAERADAVLPPAAADAAAWLDALHEVPGHHALLHPGDSPAPTSAPDDPAVVGAVAEALDLPPDLAAAWPPAWLVEHADDAVRLARAWPGHEFVSRDGTLARAGLVELHGPDPQPGLLTRDEERARLDAERQETATSRAELERERQSLVESIGSLEETIARRRDELTEAERRAAVATARAEDVAARRRRLDVERQTLETEHSEVRRELDRLRERDAGLARELEEAQEEHRRLEARFDERQAALEEARERRAALQTSGASRRGRLEVLGERLESHRRGVERVRHEIAEREEEEARWEEERERLQQRREELRGEIEEAEGALQEALERRGEAEQELARQQELVAERRQRVRGFEEELESARTALDGAREELSTARVEEASVAGRHDHLAADFRELAGEAPPQDPGEAPAELAEMEADLERLKQRLAAMGPVNPLAAEEQRELEERLAFLTEQRADVAASVERLRATIREIDQTSATRFEATFRHVNENFGKLFQELFRGGEAEMRLLDEEDLLESGIEILARPPGKRLQNLMLLSGGEKSLTAIALLFALFRHKPSPFCILDEVDAALDDLNTLRFVRLLEQLAGETQFVVITHNKLTMEAAARLYGVTMQERGVSSLVAVELDDIQPAPLTETAASA